MGHDNIIELNGKRYDALTGKYLGKSRSTPVPATPKAGQTIDGVRRTKPKHKPSNSSATHHAKKEPEHKSGHHKTHHKPGAGSGKKPTHRKKASHAKPHAQQRSKTLMRSSVKKPDIQSNTKKQIAQKQVHNLEFKKAAHAVNTERLKRSRQVSKHQHIDRFGRTSFSHQQVETPKQQPANIQPEPTTEHRHLKPSDVFESAISKANSHEQPPHKVKPSRKRRALTIVSAVAVLLIAVGTIAWTQKSTIELKVASFQAGFQASQPSYNLTDYQRVSTRYEHSQVAITYQSGNRHYEITQQESDWNSQTLLDSAVASASTEEPQVIESKGRIVYLYEGNNASWVDGGVRYDITGDANLTREDIKAIVDSM